ncbi:MAG: hypothetical protein KJ023_00265 [Burkholderiaceae bacterium]|nr:hypothetical protein [Burkholderiaceae bacterium]
MNARRTWILCCAAALLAGCSTTPDAPGTQAEARDHDILEPGMRWRPELAATMARVRIVRDSGLISGACAFRVFLDNRPVVQLYPGQFYEVALAPGRHEVYVTFTGVILCGGHMTVSNQVSFEARAGTTLAVRTGIRDTRLSVFSVE